MYKTRNNALYVISIGISQINIAYHFRAGGNNYKRVRSTLPADDMGERGEDGDEETLYDRTESTSQF